VHKDLRRRLVSRQTGLTVNGAAFPPFQRSHTDDKLFGIADFVFSKTLTLREDQMDTKLYLAILAIVAVIYGVIFVLFPAQAIALYGVTGEPHAAYNAQYFGSALLGLGVISWSARSFKDWDAVRAVLIGGLVTNIVGLPLTLWGLEQGLVNAMGWSSVVLYVLLIAGAAYCLKSNPRLAG
jgi:hypothetical protein